MNQMKLAINGVPVRAPLVGGITRKREKVWSKNTGRTASGRMQGSILTLKTTLSFSWPPLTKAEMDAIEAAVSDQATPFSVVELTHPDGTVESWECYFGTPSYTHWELVGGVWRTTDAKVDAIER